MHVPRYSWKQLCKCFKRKEMHFGEGYKVLYFHREEPCFDHYGQMFLCFLFSWFVQINSRRCLFSSQVPLYHCRRRGRNKNIIKWAPVKAQAMKNNVENTMETCLFNVSMWEKLQSPHVSTQIWCFRLLFFFSSVERRLQWMSHASCMSLFIC